MRTDPLVSILKETGIDFPVTTREVGSGRVSCISSYTYFGQSGKCTRIEVNFDYESSDGE